MNDSTGTRLLRKPFGDVQRDAAVQDLSRSLGAWHLVFFGVGCIIGSGIFVLTGNAAANFAGRPAAVRERCCGSSGRSVFQSKPII